MAMKKGKRGKSSKKESCKGKPYGPAQSPLIFAAKWIEKFRHLARIHLPPEVDRTPSYYIEIQERKFAHLYHFHIQATELQLTASDFDGINPFVLASQEQVLVDMCMQLFRDVKHGKKPFGGLPWSAIPLSVRGRINDLLMHVDEAISAGWWVVTDEARQGFLKKGYEDDEQGE